MSAFQSDSVPLAMANFPAGIGTAQRQLREELLGAVRCRGIDVVLVWRLDRWGRTVADLLVNLQELDHLGSVSFP